MAHLGRPLKSGSLCFIRSLGIVQTALSKSTSSQTASCSSLFRTMVSMYSFHAEADRRQRRHVLELLEHDADLGRRPTVTVNGNGTPVCFPSPTANGRE